MEELEVEGAGKTQRWTNTRREDEGVGTGVSEENGGRQNNE